ncbi:MAG: thioredoxin-disulfide reductase [Candidatus Thermoplasmatota archaeon]|nr:thioredoxin-disulfide reductase [Candidatus Thermoplasmatota archaeon]
MTQEFDLAIIGGGPAGMTAAIYAGRSGLRAAVLEKAMAGGQIALSYLIENWPGDAEISGADLSARMRGHAERYASIIEFSEITSIEKEDVFVIDTPEGKLRARAVLIATGAEHRKLGVPGEEGLGGRGVSYCATCDGFFFKGKRVLVVGGGNTAVEYAIYLHNIGCDVSLVHRRGELRAEMKMQEELGKRDIQVIWNSVVLEFRGDGTLKEVLLRDKLSGVERTVEADGVFVAVGEVPNNEIPKRLGLDLDPDGYVIVDRMMRTSIPGIYAAGDVTGGLKQVVVAAGEGAIAATTAFEDLREPYWIG